MSVSQHEYDAYSVLNANKYSRTGYDFDGWNTVADGSGTSYANGESVKNLTSINGTTVPLYAQWKPKTYTVIYTRCSSIA